MQEIIAFFSQKGAKTLKNISPFLPLAQKMADQSDPPFGARVSWPICVPSDHLIFKASKIRLGRSSAGFRLRISVPYFLTNALFTGWVIA